MTAERKIFLSHRFADKQIANVVRRHLGIWGFDTTIFQASAPGHGTRVGEHIADEIKDALHRAKLVILIYTLTDHDWSFCMWECGLATHPKKADTRTIVLQCNAHDTPRIFEGQLLIRVDQESIKNFTMQFHRDDDFLPGEPAIRADIKDETIADLSDRFYYDLCEVIAPGQREERYRWDSLTLQLTQEELAAIKSLDEQDALQAIQDKCRIAHQFGEALKHFGYANLEPDLKLSHLVERWSQRTQGRDNVSSEWIKELQSEIYRAIDNSPANPEWKALNSANYVGSWFYPVVNHVRIVPDGSMEFDIYIYRLPRADQSVHKTE